MSLYQTEFLPTAEESSLSTAGSTGPETLTITSTDTGFLPTYTSHGQLSHGTQTTAVDSTQTTTPSHTGPAPTAENSNNGTTVASTQSGLSTGAKVGIGVAVPIGVIVILIALWLLRRRKKRSCAPEKQPPPAGVSETGLPEIDGNALNEVDGQSAVPANRVYELSGSSIRRRSNDRSFPMAREKNKSESEKETMESRMQEVVEMRASTDYGHWETGPTSVVELGNVATLPTEAAGEMTSPEPGSRPYDEMGLDDLEEEMARVRRRKERLQHLQSLEEQEEELRRQIAARRTNALAS